MVKIELSSSSHLTESLGAPAQPGVHQQSPVLPVSLLLPPHSPVVVHSSSPSSLLLGLWRSRLPVRNVTPINVTRLTTILRTVVLTVSVDNLLVAQIALFLNKES